MSSNPTKYGDVGKTGRDILAKFFPRDGKNSFTSEFDLKANKNFSTKGKIVKNDKGSNAEVTDKVNIEDFTIEATYKTEKPALDLTVAYNELGVDGLEVKFLVSASKDSQYVGGTVAYTNEYATANLKAYVPVSTAFINFVKQDAIAAQDYKVNFDIVVSSDDTELFAGGKVDATFPSNGGYNLEEVSALVGYEEDSFVGTLGYTQKIDRRDDDKVKKSVALNGSLKDEDRTYAAALDYSVEDKTAKFQFGVQKKIDSDTTFKVKFDTSKTVGFALTSQLNERVTLNFGSAVDINTTEALAIGTGITFGLKYKN